MTSSPGDALATTIKFADDLPPFWRGIMGPGGFGYRALWVAMFDDDGHPLPLLMPIDGVPAAPDAAGHQLLSTLGPMAIDTGAASLAFALARPGTGIPTSGDRQWATVLDAANNELPLKIWPVFLATKGRITPLRPIDF